jgi:hypothetical protein
MREALSHRSYTNLDRYEERKASLLIAGRLISVHLRRKDRD